MADAKGRKIVAATVVHRIAQRRRLASARIGVRQIHVLHGYRIVFRASADLSCSLTDAVRQHRPELHACGNFGDHGYHGLMVAEPQVESPCVLAADNAAFVELHRPGNHRPGALLIQAILVAPQVSPGDGLRVVVAAQGAERDCGRIVRAFAAGAEVGAVRHVNQPRTMDRAAVAATGAGQNRPGHFLPGNIVGMLECPLTVIPCRKHAMLVHQVHNASEPIGREHLTGDDVIVAQLD